MERRPLGDDQVVGREVRIDDDRDAPDGLTSVPGLEARQRQRTHTPERKKPAVSAPSASISANPRRT